MEATKLAALETPSKVAIPLFFSLTDKSCSNNGKGIPIKKEGIKTIKNKIKSDEIWHFYDGSAIKI